MSELMIQKAGFLKAEKGISREMYSFRSSKKKVGPSDRSWGNHGYVNNIKSTSVTTRKPDRDPPIVCGTLTHCVRWGRGHRCFPQLEGEKRCYKNKQFKQTNTVYIIFYYFHNQNFKRRF